MESSSNIPLPFRYVLAVYGIVPLCLLIAAFDQLAWGGRLKAVLPRIPDQIFLYALIFVIPHIIAGLFSFADGEYLSFYRQKLLFEIPLFSAACLFVYFFHPAIAFLLYVAYTEYHTIQQQGGIGHFFFKTGLPEYRAWKWIAIIVAILGYGFIYRGSLLLAQIANAYTAAAVCVLFIPLLAATALMFRRISSVQGREYLLAMTGSVLAGFLLILAGYPIFAVLCARFIHDVTAFMAYLNHDHNRRRESEKNIVYRFLSLARVPAYIFAPLLAISVAFWVVRVPYVAGAAVFLISMLHYYVEGFIWKRGSLHRRYLAFGE